MRSLVMLALSMTLIGCSILATLAGVSPQGPQAARLLASGDVVDGIRVGILTECVPDPDCATRVTLAKAATIERHGVLPTAIGAAHFYQPYVPPGATLGSGGGTIVVFDLEDGSQAAVHTFCMDTCFVVGIQPVQPLTLERPNDHGPLVDPLVEAPRDCDSADHPTCNEAVQVAIETATGRGVLTPDTIAEAHYYVIYVAPGSSDGAEYSVDIYVAGEHDVLAETAVRVSCASGPCQVVP